MSNEGKKSYIDIIECKQCWKILRGFEKEDAKMWDEMEKDEKSIDKFCEPIKYIKGSYEADKTKERRIKKLHQEKYKSHVSIGKMRRRFKMGSDDFQYHLKHHLLKFKILRRMNKNDVTIGENLSIYYLTRIMIENIKAIPPDKIVYYNGTLFFNSNRPKKRKLQKISKQIKDSLRSILTTMEEEENELPKYLLVLVPPTIN